MDHTSDKIHVMPLGDQWEVEAQSGAPLAHETDREAAIETAKAMAGERGMPSVVLHDGDGVTEEIVVPPPTQIETQTQANP
jgi:hypothetical protein